MGKSPSEHFWHDEDVTDRLPEWDLSEEHPGGPVQVLVVDDDPSFGKILERIGRQSHVKVTVCQSLEQLRNLSFLKFHAAIIDYDLGSSDGIEVARRFDQSAHKFPIILVSQSQLVETPISCWPANVKGFLHKAIGHFAILEAALAAHDASATTPTTSR